MNPAGPVPDGFAGRLGRQRRRSVAAGSQPARYAVPEFDGRIITVPFSFQRSSTNGLPWYQPTSERCARVAGIAVSARLRQTARRPKVAIMLSAYPPNTPASATPVGWTPAQPATAASGAGQTGYDIGDDGRFPVWRRRFGCAHPRSSPKGGQDSIG